MESDWLWWKDGVIYQIYPRSFLDTNEDGMGDLNGITSKLDYLRELGIDAVWISPFFPNGGIDGGYDVTDYTEIDPCMGTMADFDRLLSEAHRRNIRVVLDLVLNHTSDQHPWFVESRKDKTNPYHDWYLWQDPGPGGRVPNNWQAISGGRAWKFDPLRGQYFLHTFLEEQPDLNWRNPAVKEELFNVMRFWFNRGVDGFRMDIFGAYFKDAQFRDNPTFIFGRRGFDRQKHLYDSDQPELIPLIAEMRNLADEKNGRYIVGETYNPTAEKAARYCEPGLLHGAFNFDLLDSPWNPLRMAQSIQRWERMLAPESWPTNFLNNHDYARSATRYHCSEKNDERLKLAAALLLTLRGTPFLYYGEEIGMRNRKMKREEIHDPVSRRYWPFFPPREAARSPMQWDKSQYAGFSTQSPWNPLHPNSITRNVAEHRKNPDSLWHFYRKLIQLRKEHTALHRGMYMPITFDQRRILAYLRQTNEQTVLVALNFSGRRKVRLFLGRELARHGWKLLVSNKTIGKPNIHQNALVLQPEEVVILLQE